MAWKTASCIVTGFKNRQRNKQCQDHLDLFYDEKNEVVFGALSDGAGSTKYARIAAKIAVDESMSLMREQFKNLCSYDEDSMRGFFKDLVKRVISAIEETAKQKECALQELSCTLLVFFISKKHYAAMQIGDGFIVVKTVERDEYLLLLTPYKGPYPSTTAFVIDHNAHDIDQNNYDINKMLFSYGNGSISFICIASDGLEMMCLEFLGFSDFEEGVREWRPSYGFFNQMHTRIFQSKDTEKFGQSISRKLDDEKISKRYQDDKSLILCCNTSYNLEGISGCLASGGNDVSSDRRMPEENQEHNVSTNKTPSFLIAKKQKFNEGVHWLCREISRVVEKAYKFFSR
jgi:hypothetical protein